MADIDLISQAVQERSLNRAFDLNDDEIVSSVDRTLLIKDIFNTSFGDSNLDFQFNSLDIVAVLQAGEYNDAIPGNSTWATVDWNGDADFNSADVVLALQDGGFTPGSVAAVSSVPEPGAAILLVIGLSSLLCMKKRVNQECRKIGTRCSTVSASP